MSEVKQFAIELPGTIHRQDDGREVAVIEGRELSDAETISLLTGQDHLLTSPDDEQET